MSLPLLRPYFPSSATRIILSHQNAAVRRALSTLPKRSSSAAAVYAPEYEDVHDESHDSRAPTPLKPEQRKFLDGAVSMFLP
jgi:hypothetical protein